MALFRGDFNTEISTITDRELSEIRAHLGDGYDVRRPYEGERCNSAADGALCCYLHQFRLGLTFPFGQELADVLNVHGAVFGRITPNCLGLILTFILFLRDQQIPWSISLFRKCFRVCYRPEGNIVFSSQTLKIEGVESKIRDWKTKYCFVSSAHGWAIQVPPPKDQPLLHRVTLVGEEKDTYLALKATFPTTNMATTFTQRRFEELAAIPAALFSAERYAAAPRAPRRAAPRTAAAPPPAAAPRSAAAPRPAQGFRQAAAVCRSRRSSPATSSSSSSYTNSSSYERSKNSGGVARGKLPVGCPIPADGVVLGGEPPKRRRDDGAGPSSSANPPPSHVRYTDDGYFEFDVDVDPLDFSDPMDPTALDLGPLVYSKTIDSAIVKEGVEALPFSTMRALVALWQYVRHSSMEQISQRKAVAALRESLLTSRSDRDKRVEELERVSADLRREVERLQAAGIEREEAHRRQISDLEVRLAALPGPSAAISVEEFERSSPAAYKSLIHNLEKQISRDMILVLRHYSRLPYGPETLDQYDQLFDQACEEDIF